MKMKFKQYTACILIVFLMLLCSNVVTANEFESNASAETNTETNAADEAVIDENTEGSEDIESIADKLVTVLDPENNELEETTSRILEKYSNNWLVKMFKTIIDTIRNFIDAILTLASEAAKIGVD